MIKEEGGSGVVAYTRRAGTGPFMVSVNDDLTPPAPASRPHPRILTVLNTMFVRVVGLCGRRYQPLSEIHRLNTVTSWLSMWTCVTSAQGYTQPSLRTTQ